MRHHLAILKKAYLAKILNGSKTAECRLSRTRRAPYKAVDVGDRLWLKVSGGAVVATAVVRAVRFFHPLGPASLTQLRKRYAKCVRADRGFFSRHERARYGTLIHLGHVQAIEPFTIAKSDRRAWVVLPGPLRRRPKKASRNDDAGAYPARSRASRFPGFTHTQTEE